MYLGNQPALSYTSFAKQDFTTSATTSYSLDHPVANANELALFINFVRQEPTTAYSASGTSLTLTSATASSDDMYCVYLGKAVQTVNPPNASVGLSQLTASGTKDATTFLRGDNTFAVAGGANTPAFLAYSANGQEQSISNSTSTKLDFETELYDTDNAFSSNTTFTCPSGQAGKYQFTANISWYTSSSSSFERAFIMFYKNGSQISNFERRGTDIYRGSYSQQSLNNTIDVNCAVGDTVEVYGWFESITATYVTSSYTMANWFKGFKLIT